MRWLIIVYRLIEFAFDSNDETSIQRGPLKKIKLLISQSSAIDRHRSDINSLPAADVHTNRRPYVHNGTHTVYNCY